MHGLVDKARRVAPQATGQKVEGRTRFTTVHGSWFKCRVTMEASPEAADQGGENRVAEHAVLLFGRRDTEGTLMTDPDTGRCVVRPTDRIETSSLQLGSSLWEVTEEPRVLRRKRSILGYEASVVRIDYDDFTPIGP